MLSRSPGRVKGILDCGIPLVIKTNALAALVKAQPALAIMGKAAYIATRHAACSSVVCQTFARVFGISGA